MAAEAGRPGRPSPARSGPGLHLTGPRGAARRHTLAGMELSTQARGGAGDRASPGPRRRSGNSGGASAFDRYEVQSSPGGAADVEEGMDEVELYGPGE